MSLKRIAFPVIALAAALALSACASPGKPFAVETRVGYDFVDFAAAPVDAAPISGRLVLPEGGAPKAAAILSHGSAGPGDRQREAAELLAKAGYAALILDHFGSRGVSSTAEDQIRISEQQMAADIFAARDALAARLGLAPSRIGAVGWSKGATATTLAAVERLGALTAPGASPLAFAVAFYPFCGFQLDDEPLASPLLMLLGGQDDWTPARPCLRQVERWREVGEPASAVLYDDAFHGFDSRAGRFRAATAITVTDTSLRCTLKVDEAGRTVTLDGAFALTTPETRRDYLAACGERGVTFAGNPAARDASRDRMLAFIAEALTP